MHRINLKILIILSVITFIAGFLRFYKLDQYPVQLNHDEISQIYDVASIVETKKDIYGNFLPLAFPSTGDIKVGHYIYITVLPYLIFGMKEITVRIPAAFFGTLIIPAAFLFINQLTKNWRLALAASAALAVTPSEIFYSRKSFESVIGIFFVFSSLFLLFKQLEEKGSKLSIFFTAVCLALPMYIYTAYTIVMPLVVFTFGVLFWEKIVLQTKKFTVILAIWGLLVAALILITISNPGIRFRAASVSILQDANLSSQLQNIEKNNSIFLPLFKLGVITQYSFTKYLKQFDPSRIFASGLDFTNQGLLSMGPLMLFQLPFFILGIIYLFKSQFFVSGGKFILCLLFIAMIPSALTFEEFSPHRSVWAFSLMSIISAFGIFWAYNFIQKIVNFPIKIIVLCLGAGLAFFNFVYFIHMYTVNLPFEKSQQIHYPYKNVALYAWSQHNKFDQIIVDPVYGEIAPVKAVAVHYYLAYYSNYLPSKFQKDLKIDKTGMYFGKFSIREIDWRKDQGLKNTLIITSPWSVSIENVEKSKILKEFTFYNGQPAFYAIGL